MPLKGIGFCKGCKGKPQRLANSKSIKFKATPESTNAMKENDDNEQIKDTDNRNLDCTVLMLSRRSQTEVQHFPRNIDNWQGLMSPANLNTPVRIAISRYTCPRLQPRDNCITTYNHRREPKSRIHNRWARTRSHPLSQVLALWTSHLPGAQVMDHSHAHLALSRLDGQTGSVNLPEHLLLMLQVVIPGGTEDVIQVHHHVLLQSLKQLKQDSLTNPRGHRSRLPHRSSNGENPVEAFGTFHFSAGNRSTIALVSISIPRKGKTLQGPTVLSGENGTPNFPAKNLNFWRRKEQSLEFPGPTNKNRRECSPTSKKSPLSDAGRVSPDGGTLAPAVALYWCWPPAQEDEDGRPAASAVARGCILLHCVCCRASLGEGGAPASIVSMVRCWLVDRGKRGQEVPGGPDAIGVWSWHRRLKQALRRPPRIPVPHVGQQHGRLGSAGSPPTCRRTGGREDRPERLPWGAAAARSAGAPGARSGGTGSAEAGADTMSRLMQINAMGKNKSQLVTALVQREIAQRPADAEAGPSKNGSAAEVQPQNAGPTSNQGVLDPRLQLALQQCSADDRRLQLVLQFQEAERAEQEAQAWRDNELQMAQLGSVPSTTWNREPNSTQIPKPRPEHFPVMEKDGNLNTFLLASGKACRQLVGSVTYWWKQGRIGDRSRYPTQGLQGNALEAIAALPQEQDGDYEAIKQALITKSQLTPEVHRRKFRNLQSGPHDSYSDMAHGLRTHFDQWTQGLSVITFAQLRDLMIKDQFLHLCPAEVGQFVKDREPKDVTKAVQIDDDYEANHKSELRKPVTTSWRVGKPATNASAPASQHTRDPVPIANSIRPTTYPQQCFSASGLVISAPTVHRSRRIPQPRPQGLMQFFWWVGRLGVCQRAARHRGGAMSLQASRTPRLNEPLSDQNWQTLKKPF
ncbi:unnamed protein product [Ranitomeya imitator]|uniref:SCAN box domain-containing protein n=1 Tax=Ranitomeya imitator TaxID=111125 RepID=A0ABN9KSR4_9NEOB|nr:unnamed protein product [Ranitomeya imitator]